MSEHDDTQVDDQEVEPTETDEDEIENPEGYDQLGDSGKRAIERMKEQIREERKRRQEAERGAPSPLKQQLLVERRKRKAAEEKAAQAAKPKPDGNDQPDLDAIRKQARDEAAAEALRDRVLDKIEAKARKFADSEDAAAILLRSHQVDDFIDGGKVDVSAIAEALDELAEAKPHLLARNGASGGSFDTGRGKQAEKAQLTRADLAKMTPAQIEAARKAGRLSRLMTGK